MKPMDDKTETDFNVLCERLGGEVAWLRKNWREVMRDYEGQNIAIARGRIVAAGDHYRPTVALALERGWRNPFMAKMPRREQIEESHKAEHQTH